MLKATWFVSTGLFLALLVCSCRPLPSTVNNETFKGDITVSGAFALYPLMTRWAEEFHRYHPGVHFEIASGGAGAGMRAILGNKVDIAMISREITFEEQRQGAYPLAVARDAVFLLANADNPVRNELLAQGINRETLIKVFITGEVTQWGELADRPQATDGIHIYTRSDICGAAATWGLYLGGEQGDLLGEGKFGDPGIVRAIQNDRLGIGYANLIYAYGLGDVPPPKTIILPLDLNQNGQADAEEFLDTREKAVEAVEAGRYPVPPARTLYLVTNGKPEGIVQAFLSWILTEGQAYVDASGYVQLPKPLLDQSLEKIR